MFITKYKHSCLFVEDQQARVLFDPGCYSWQEFKDKLLGIVDLDFIVITHEHPDHYFPEALSQIIKANPRAKIVCGETVANMLKNDGLEIDREFTSSLFSAQINEHAHLNQTVPVFENVSVTFNGKLLHPGDYMKMTKSPEVLALPIFGPWYNGTISDAIDLAIKLKPTFIIPIHDWHYNEEAKKDFHKRLTDTLTPLGISVLIQPDGQAVSV